MVSVTIEYNKKRFALTHPERFNELNPEQFRAVVEYFVLPETALEYRPDDQLKLLQELLGKKLNRNFKTNWYRVMDEMVTGDGIIWEILKLQEFLYKEQQFNAWILKELKVKGQELYGPRDRFSYMKFGQFISADMLFMGYYANKSEDLLNKFIAVLYLPQLNADFETESLDERAELLSALSDIDKQAIVFNYAGVRFWLTEKYPFVFKQEENKNEIRLGKSQHGWMSIRRQLAGDVLNLEKVDKVSLHDVLMDLNEKMSE